MIRWSVTADWWLIAGVVGLAVVGGIALISETCKALVDIIDRACRKR